MRLSDLLTRTKLALDNVNARKWNDANIALVLNGQLRSMIRQMVKTDQGYTNFRFVLPKTVARTVHLTDFSYRLPRWVARITDVREYLGAGMQRGAVIRRASKYQSGGWRLTGVNELMLFAFSTALDLEIECAKMPAALTRGTLPSQAGVLANQMKLDSDSSVDALNFPHESEIDAYAGALFEITGPATTRVGQVLRCVGSSNDPTGRLLTMEENWGIAPAAADTYDMHAEIGDDHLELLVLLTTRRLLAQEGNAKGISVYSPELNEQWTMFTQSIATRQLAEPSFIGSVPSNPSDREFFEEW